MSLMALRIRDEIVLESQDGIDDSSAFVLLPEWVDQVKTTTSSSFAMTHQYFRVG
jgi:hypothetical protein